MRSQPGETIELLSDWMAKSSLGKLHNFSRTRSNEELGSRGALIYDVARMLTEEVSKLHQKGLTMCGSLSPDNIYVSEKRTSSSVVRRVFIKDFSTAEVDPQWLAPWYKNMEHENVLLNPVFRMAQSNRIPSPEDKNYGMYMAGVDQADIFALGAIYWALCEGNTEFMKVDDWWSKENIKQTAQGKEYSCWKIFALACICLDDCGGGDMYGLPKCPRNYNLREILQILSEEACHEMHGDEDEFLEELQNRVMVQDKPNVP